MSLIDFIPKSLRQFIPFINSGSDREELKAQLESLQRQVEKQKKTSDSKDESESTEASDEQSSNELLESINRIKGLLAEPNTPWYKKLIKIGIYIVPLILSYYLAIYLQESNGLELDQQEMIYPVGLYETEEGNPPTFVLKQESEDRFWNEFPKYYFSDKSDPYSQFDKNLLFFDDSISFLEAKIVLKNTSSSFPLMLSSLQIDVTNTDSTRFPWENVNAVPKIEVKTKDGRFRIFNKGYAPALEPETVYRLTKNDSVVLLNKWDSFEPSVLYFSGGTSFEHNNIPHVNGYLLANVDQNTRGLIDTFYVFHNPEKEKNSNYNYTRINGNEFIVISNVTILKEQTDVIETNKINMSFSYESVKRVQYKKEWETKLDSSLFYYENTENILTYEEAEYYGLYPVYRTEESNSYSEVADLSYEIAEKLYAALGNKPSPHPEGVSLITKNVEINLAYFGKGETFTNFVNTDQILNPDGYVVIYLKLLNPSNGEYRVSLKTNGEVISEVDVKTLIPEETSFNYHYQSLDLFNPTEAKKVDED